uniref:hemerythrin domain-containing protein n=1 Tax=Paractinoplanes polyasparticus TaxID=2856853 RepID=UPI001C843D7E|nr:hemerythrin domain-containing protein [Actinoplanes polyasparticus]
MADSRDMIGAHDMFRAQFGALPALILQVAPGETARAGIVGAHVDLLVKLLHGHHGAEDVHVWPKLHERCSDKVQGLVATMETQHSQIDLMLQNLTSQARAWSSTGSAGDRDALAAAAERLVPALKEHLALEESEALALIDEFLTDEEWRASVASSAGKLTPEQGPLAIGMMLHEADEQMEALIRGGAPEHFWNEVRPVAVSAYAEYATRVYGSPALP